MSIQNDLKATGLANVIVVLQQPATAAASVADFKAISKKAVRALSGSLTDFFEGEKDIAAIESAAAASLAKVKAVVGKLKKKTTVRAAGMRVFENLGIVLGTVDRDGLKKLQQHDNVASVHSAPQLSLIRPVRREAAASLASAATSVGGFTWGLDRLGVPALRAQGLTGKDVLVGHLDTGVDGTHPALQGAIAQFAEFDLNGDPVPGATAHDSAEHGTHTAGTILGRKQGSVEFGMSPGASLVSGMVIEGGKVIDRILAGMDWAVGLKVRIVSMSLGLRGFDDSFLPLTRILRQRNILPVFAVGNEGVRTSRSPGNYAEALSVGFYDENDQVADLSSSQRFLRAKDPRVPDLVGPGVNIASSVPGGGFAVMDGSSMATPHIAGLAALLMEAKPDATADQIEAAIFASCVLPATMNVTRANRGIPNGPTALANLP